MTIFLAAFKKLRAMFDINFMILTEPGCLQDVDVLHCKRTAVLPGKYGL